LVAIGFHPCGVRRFRSVRFAATQRQPGGEARLVAHVAKWIRQGARIRTIGRKLGLTDGQVLDYAKKAECPR
jgi:hypothetical protein